MEGHETPDEFFLYFNDTRKNSDKTINICQFVSDVLDFSSQYGSDSSISYSAYNLSGKPSKFPDYGDFPQAFVMKTYGTWWKETPSWPADYMPQNNPEIVSDDYVDIKFEEKVYALKVKIFETYNPGSVVRIWALNARHDGNKWVLLWQGAPQRHSGKSRMFSPPLNYTNFMTKIEFNHSALDYHTGIDGIVLEGSSFAPRHITQQVIELNLHNIPCQSNDLKKVLSNLKTCNEITEDCQSAVTLEILPPETTLKILSYLDLPSLLKVAQVSRRLNQLASDKLLFCRLSLRPYWYTIRDSQLLNLSQRCRNLKCLDLSWCGNHGMITSEVFNQFVTDCGRSLTHVRLNCCKFVGNLTMKALANTCPQLQELSLRNCKSISEAGFMHLSSLEKLISLDLYRTLITGECLLPILKGNDFLQHLNIASCIKITNLDLVVHFIGNTHKGLISLELWKTTGLSHNGIKALSLCSSLQELDLGWCVGLFVPVEGLGILARGCPRLRKLFLTALRGITDADIEPFAKNCRELEQVDLLGVHGVTAYGCLGLLQELPRLRLLDLSFCYQVTHADITRWRLCFPHVAIKRSTQAWESPDENINFIA